jgi:peptide/nickel transport system ATP-binding protein
MSLLRIEDLWVEFRAGGGRAPTIAVQHVDLHIDPGEVLAVVGESGSGKSVSAQAVLRLLPKTALVAGRIRWGDEDILNFTPERLGQLRGGEIGMIFQEPMSALNPTMSCGEQIMEAMELHGVASPIERRRRALELLHEVAIPEPDRRLDQYPHELSGGMRQRICIAMALACSPKLLIADEPTTALDVTVQAQILDLIGRLRRERTMAVLFITHDLALVRELADRVAIMRRGEKVEEGPVASVFAAPQHAYTKALLACRPRPGSRGTKLPTVEDILQQERGA